MSLKSKHTVEEIDGVRCTIVESGISQDRANYLKEILTFNGLEAKIGEAKGKTDPAGSFVLGVTNVIFNPTIAIYQKKLKTKDGHIVTPALWEQAKEQTNIPYYQVKK